MAKQRSIVTPIIPPPLAVAAQPAPMIGDGAKHGSDRAPDEKHRHVNGIDPSAGLRRNPIDRPLADDLIRLHGGINQNCQQDEYRQRIGLCRPTRCRRMKGRARSSCRRLCSAKVPRSVKRPANGAASAPPQPASANSAMPRWLIPKRFASMSGAAVQKHAESGEHQPLVCSAPAHGRHSPQHPDHRYQNLTIMHAAAWLIARHHPRQGESDREYQRRRAQKDRAASRNSRQ